MLNAKQILDEGLLKLERTQGKPAQVGWRCIWYHL